MLKPKLTRDKNIQCTCICFPFPCWERCLESICILTVDGNPHFTLDWLLLCRRSSGFMRSHLTHACPSQRFHLWPPAQLHIACPRTRKHERAFSVPSTHYTAPFVPNRWHKFKKIQIGFSPPCPGPESSRERAGDQKRTTKKVKFP